MEISADALLSSLANATRLRSVVLLLRHDELCVCEITHALDLSQPQVSRHLALLREAGVVADRRDGLWVYYRINPLLPAWVHAVLRDLFRGVAEQAAYQADADALLAMPNRPGASRCA